MKKFTIYVLALLFTLVLFLLSVMPALAQKTAFSFSQNDYRMLFDALLKNVDKEAVWKERDGVLTGTYPDAPEIQVITDADGLVTAIRINSRIRYTHVMDFMNASGIMGEALACASLTAIMLTDPAAAMDPEGYARYTMDMENLLSGSVLNADPAGHAAAETLTYGGVTIQSLFTVDAQRTLYTFTFDLVPVK